MDTKSKNWFVYFFLLIATTNILSQSVDRNAVTGKVYDNITKKPIKNANVYILGTLKGSATDQNGEFIIRNVPNN